MRLTMRVRTHKYRVVCACTCDYLSEARERTLDDCSLSSALIETYVILNAVKNLEVSVAVDGSTSLEILRYTQDDIINNVALRVSLHRADLPTPEKSHYHRGWG